MADLLKAFQRPTAKVSGCCRPNPITKRKNHVQIEEREFALYLTGSLLVELVGISDRLTQFPKKLLTFLYENLRIFRRGRLGGLVEEDGVEGFGADGDGGSQEGIVGGEGTAAGGLLGGWFAAAGDEG